jgi:hypothetical protein
LPHASAELDELASRARWSGVLPKVRLRVTRLIDESSSLSPTSYDPSRITSKGGASLWLEARTTWTLDRLVFADKEVALERLQLRLLGEANHLRRRVLDMLFRWQEARLRTTDPMLEPNECFDLWLEAEELGVVLDVETGGWFSKWRVKRGVAPIVCDHEPPVEVIDVAPQPTDGGTAK